MKRFLVFFAVLFFGTIAMLFFLFGSSGKTTTVTKLVAEPLQLDLQLQATLSEFEHFVAKAVKEDQVPGAAVAIVKGSQIVFLKGFGSKSADAKDPIDINTLFRLGSVSKPVTASLVGMLVEDSVLNWDDPVTKYLPDFKLKTPEATAALKVKHILSHTTGLPYHAYTNLVEEGHDLQYLIDRLGEVDVVGETGEFYSYQNVAYSLIEKVIESATHKTFENELREKVFGPLRMSHSSANFNDFSLNKNTAEPHLLRGGKWRNIPVSETYYNVAAAGGINASISDMGKWLVAMMGHRRDIIDVPTLDDLYAPHIRATAKNRNFNRWKRIRRAYYGYGWRVIQFPNDTLLYHGGYVNGFRSEVALDRTDDIAICVLTNASGDFSDIAVPVFFSMYDKHTLEPATGRTVASTASPQ